MKIFFATPFEFEMTKLKFFSHRTPLVRAFLSFVGCFLSSSFVLCAYEMIVPRLRSEARGGSSSGSSTRYSNSGVYAGKVHGHHGNDPDLKRALQYSYTSQTVRKWEKRWVVIHETSMKVHKWMPAPVSALANQNAKVGAASANAPPPPPFPPSAVEKAEEETANNDNENENSNNNNDNAQMEINNVEPTQQEETSQSEPEKATDIESQSSTTQESNVLLTQDTQMLVDEESTSQSSQP